MEVEIRSRKIEIDEVFRTHVERRLLFTLGRFGERIARVTLRFDSVNYALRGDEIQCLIDVDLRPSGSVITLDTDVDLYSVFERVVERVAEAVNYELARRRESEQR